MIVCHFALMDMGMSVLAAVVMLMAVLVLHVVVVVHSVRVGVARRAVRVLVCVDVLGGNVLRCHDFVPFGVTSADRPTGCFSELSLIAMVARNSGAGMLGVVDRIDDELADMVVLQPVENLRPLPPGPDEPRHAQLREVLRHRRSGLSDVLGEVVHRSLRRGQRPEDLNAGGIREHPEHLDDEGRLFVGKPLLYFLTICMHTRIVAVEELSRPGLGINSRSRR